MYHHKAVGQIELMVMEAVTKADDLIHIKKCLNDKDSNLFLKLTDSIEETIEFTEDQVL
jgi:hypothetical protein